MRLTVNLGFSEMNTRIRSSLVANPLACTGCQTCVTACALIKTGRIFPKMARLYINRDPFEGKSVPNVCHQCSIPYCLDVCTAEAIGISERTGVVKIEEKKCVGCRSCEKACPFGMIIFDEEEKKSFKCDLCNGNPLCTKVCPMHALGIAHFGRRDLK